MIVDGIANIHVHRRNVRRNSGHRERNTNTGITSIESLNYWSGENSF